LDFSVVSGELLTGCSPFGEILLNADGDPLGADAPITSSLLAAYGRLPLRWISHYLDPNTDPHEWKDVPAFEWTIGQ
jgi:hypothetical protein